MRNPPAGAVPLSEWPLPVASYWLRVGMDRSQFAWQFVPCAAACVLLVGYRLWRGAAWDWPRELPRVVWVSVLATPYGGWIFDLTVLLVPVVAVAAVLLGPRASCPPAFHPRGRSPAIGERRDPGSEVGGTPAVPGATAAIAFLAAHLGIVAASLTWAGALHGYWWVAPAVLLVSAARPGGYTTRARSPD